MPVGKAKFALERRDLLKKQSLLILCKIQNLFTNLSETCSSFNLYSKLNATFGFALFAA